MKPHSRPVRTEADWALIKQRFASAEAALDHDVAATSELSRDILRARAKALAQPLPSAAQAGEHVEILEFGLAQESYALEMAYVHEVHALKELTPLPCTPAFVRGIVNVRGRILSVIDIKRFFEIPEQGLTDLNQVIVLSDRTMKFGILADRIIGVRWLSLADIQGPLPTLTGIRADYLKGITAGRLVVLDAKKLLADRSIVVEQDVT